ncbi:MAG: hypothetical protein E6J34_00025 [Chloroflexi bacterium]|nr:MAG: hypothetical protein E6J34_00025 [Chloroflexota bacterium]
MYLSWLIREHRYLSLLPAQLVARLWRERQKLSNLEQVFVQLSISAHSRDEHWAQTYGGSENTWRKPPILGLRALRTMLRLLLLPLVTRFALFTEPTYQPGDLALVIDRYKRLVLRGDPGSGKTTLLRYLALTCARVFLAAHFFKVAPFWNCSKKGGVGAPISAKNSSDAHSTQVGRRWTALLTDPSSS